MDRDFLNKSTLGVVERFCREAETAGTMTTLARALDAAVKGIGFRWFQLQHNVDWGKRQDGLISLSTFPEDWAEEYHRNRFFLDDPIQVAASKTVGGISWHRIKEKVALTSRQRTVLRHFLVHGIRSGFTMPLRILGEPGAAFTVGRTRNAPSDAEILSAKMIGMAAFDCAMRLSSAERSTEPRQTLSPRQLECIELIAQGKTDWEIGQILNLSKETVGEYIQAARRRYDLRTRTQLALRVIRDGHLNYDALL